MIEEHLRAFLLTRTAVTALVATNPTSDDKAIRPDELDQEDGLPAIVIHGPEEETPLNTLDGLGGLVLAEIVISALANKKTQARALSEAIRVNGTNPGTGLAGYTGAAGSGFIRSATLERRETYFEPEEDGSDNGVYVCDSTYHVWYAEKT